MQFVCAFVCNPTVQVWQALISWLYFRCWAVACVCTYAWFMPESVGR